MLKRFEVQNFKGFKENLVFDLTARDYSFNRELVRENTVNKAIIYGKNGVGKSSLGIALFDIIVHLTDKEHMPEQYLENYRNLESETHTVFFRYVFQFGDDEVVYEYYKLNWNFLFSEKLTVNGEVVIDFNYFDADSHFVSEEIAGNLNVDLPDNKLSVIKYIYRNTPTNAVPILTKLVCFCENMLWFRSLADGNAYAGLTNGRSSLNELLYKSGKIKEFEGFLQENGLHYCLEFEEVNGTPRLMARFGRENRADFFSIASSGTRVLYLFFVWSITAFDKISLLFIDEFDAFFHYESAKSIVQRLNQATSFQSILTTHNTYLMQNQLTRPDCCFIMSDNQIKNLFDSTDKEIREAHNLEKMYINGVFTY